GINWETTASLSNPLSPRHQAHLTVPDLFAALTITNRAATIPCSRAFHTLINHRKEKRRAESSREESLSNARISHSLIERSLSNARISHSLILASYYSGAMAGSM
ncbi:hypothetical protein CFP56_019861, partial [Quercus suber]